MYSFPTDPDELKGWLTSLPNNTKVRKITKHVGVCQYHFPSDVPMKKPKNRFKTPAEPPSYWDQKDNPYQEIPIPPSCRPSQRNKRSTLNSSTDLRIRSMDVDEMADFVEKDKLSNAECLVKELNERIREYCPLSSVACESGQFTVLSQKRVGNVHSFAVYFSLDLTAKTLTYEGFQNLRRVKPGPPCPDIISKWSELQSTLEFYQRQPTQSTGK